MNPLEYTVMKTLKTFVGQGFPHISRPLKNAIFRQPPYVHGYFHTVCVADRHGKMRRIWKMRQAAPYVQGHFQAFFVTGWHERESRPLYTRSFFEQRHRCRIWQWDMLKSTDMIGMIPPTPVKDKEQKGEHHEKIQHDSSVHSIEALHGWSLRTGDGN